MYVGEEHRESQARSGAISVEPDVGLILNKWWDHELIQNQESDT